VNDAVRKAKRNKASTLGKHPDSQCSRALAATDDYIVVCANDGSITIRNKNDFGVITQEIHDSREWIEVAEFSPDGAYLAVGSHDTNIYVYSVSENFSLVGTCKKHNASLTCIDWSMDS
jgi:WD40 repeat protein